MILLAFPNRPLLREGKLPAKKHPERPNIILIIADDLGYSDLASYGNTAIQTPHIDGLAKNGVRFTRAYVTSPICSPSRMGIMTGRYQNRFGGEYMPYEKFDPQFLSWLRKHYFSLRRTLPGMRALQPNLWLNRSRYTTGLAANELILAQLLKSNGYTTGLVGKWNLGDDNGNHPYQRGYDYSYYFDAALTRYVDDPIDSNRYVSQRLPWAFSELPAWVPRGGSTQIREDSTIIKDTSYLTFSLAEKASQFIGRNKDRPFFLTLTFNAPHDPFQAPRAYFDKLKTITDSTKRIYTAMIEALDDAVGIVLHKLTAEGLDDNTMVLFISDNGGATYTRATDNTPLRGGKCTHFEGGLLVPFFIRYPGIPKPLVFNRPVSALDIFTTVTALSHIQLPADRPYDGVNLLPYLQADTGLPHPVLYWRSGYSRAICKNNWKFYENRKDHLQFLFDLNTDIREQTDLSSSRPEILKELSRELDLWEKTQTIKPAWPSASDVLIDVGSHKVHFPT
ncbi:MULTISPECIES: sulfatase-like hydrolase/transferase [Niastella]|uniref:Sulfatase-like hydrolase/transferase n=1 Tax=Niastella soli TaxID=2821487 RepID=A0ABS3Z0B7_9BACT|nr:sulfatase-like hydrolase/transferase [Niastella soli]MBO9202811.1 sulfatase-like hydrolase/transferase [Niastella soli]